MCSAWPHPWSSAKRSSIVSSMCCKSRSSRCSASRRQMKFGMYDELAELGLLEIVEPAPECQDPELYRALKARVVCMSMEWALGPGSKFAEPADRLKLWLSRPEIVDRVYISLNDP